MIDNVVVVLIVALAVFFIGKRYYKMLSNRRLDCGCGSKENCPTCLDRGEHESES